MLKTMSAIIAGGVITTLAVVVVTTSTTGCRTKAAGPAIGTVKEIKSGALERRDKGAWKPLKAGDRLYPGDRLRTDGAGTAVLAADRIGAFLMGPDTEYELGSGTADFRSFLERGYVWAKASLAPGARMEISTASAVAGIRGTKFSVLNDREGVDVCTCKGMVEVGLKAGKGVAVGSGMYLAIKDGRAGEPENGRPLLERLWQGKEKRFSACLACHRKGKKAEDRI